MMDSWAKFLKVFLLTTVLAFLFCAVFLVITNPYRNVPLLAGERWPLMDVNQRYLYPSVARDSVYDSAVFGTSSSRLLKPEQLNVGLGGTFAQMSMNAAVAYEQYRLTTLYVDWRKERELPIRTIVFGIDSEWCIVGPTYPKKTKRPFPPWMYDHNPWNDILYLFESKALEIGGRTVGYWMGVNEAEYASDGYSNFLPPQSEYQLAKAQRNIYGGSGKPPDNSYTYPIAAHPQADQWVFPTHPLFEEVVAKLGSETKKIVVFVPLHFHSLGGAGAYHQQRTVECKKRFQEMLKPVPNSILIDFMIPSGITTTDENYWDPLHYSVETAENLAALIAQAVSQPKKKDSAYEVLHESF